MALLDIDELIADTVRELGGGDVGVGQTFQVVVGEQRIIRIDFGTGSLVRDGARVEHRVVAGQQRPAIAVAARSASVAGQLPRSSSEPNVSRWAWRHSLHHAFQTGGGVVGDEELPRRGPAGWGDGGGFAPDEFTAAGAEAAIAAKRQVVGQSRVEGAVAAFHRLDAEGVADGEGDQRAGRFEKGFVRSVLFVTQIETETMALGFQIVQGVERSELGTR